jgi:hypothetical protein
MHVRPAGITGWVGFIGCNGLPRTNVPLCGIFAERSV